MRAGRAAVAVLMCGAAPLGGCAEDCVDDKSAVVVTVEGDGAPILSTVDWTSDGGESGALDCEGTCEIKPADEVTVTVTVTPVEAAFGDAQTDEVDFFQAQDEKCEEPVFSYLDFSFTSGS